MRAVNAQQPRDMLGAMTDMVDPDRARARALVVPTWWLDLARQAVAASGDGLVEMGRKLAAAKGRPERWNHGSVSRFLSGKMVTDEMVDAFVALFDLPRPVYYPRDAAEAILFRAAEDARSRRLADADAAISAIEDEVRRPTGRQSGDIVSVNGAAGGKRRGSVGASRRG